MHTMYLIHPSTTVSLQLPMDLPSLSLNFTLLNVYRHLCIFSASSMWMTVGPSTGGWVAYQSLQSYKNVILPLLTAIACQ